jgi:hypothetical protein
LKGLLFGRDGGAPRSVLVLTFLLLAAAGVLLLTRTRNTPPDYTLGGPLFPSPPAAIEGLLLTSQDGQIRLDRVDDGSWTLTGAVSDYVDARAVANLLETLTRTRGGPILPGTEIEDRRYEFNGPGSVRLSVFVTGSDPISLALGAANPVGGGFYGSGAGRQACFMVPAALKKALDDLPAALQAKVLLPGVTRDRVSEIEIRRGERDFLVKRRNGRWWLRMPAEGPAYLGPEVRDYQARYDDRREADGQEADGQRTWILASSAAVNKLIYEVSDILVREIKPPVESAGLLAALDLDPPWRRVVLRGEGLNPDPTAGSPDQMTIAFGPPLNLEAVPALRRGNVLVTDLEAVTVLEQPLGVLAHTTALTFLAMEADAIELAREGRLLLRGVRTGVAETQEGRTAWLTEYPAPGVAGLQEIDRHGFTRDLAVSLDRIPVLAVLPPTGDAAVLVAPERIRITIVVGTGEDARTEILEFGFLAEERLPAGSPPLVREPSGARPVGLWFPAGGKLLQVPGQFIVTARNLSNLVPAQPPE